MVANDNLGLISTSIKPLLDKITTLISKQVLNGIPLLGDLGLERYVKKLITEEVGNRILDETNKAQDKGVTGIRGAIFNALGPSGLKLLRDFDGQNGVTLDDVFIPSNDASSIGFRFKIGTVISDSVPFAKNLGSEALGLSLDGTITPAVDLGVVIGFGVDNTQLENGVPSQNALFVDISSTEDVTANVSIGLKGENNTPSTFEGRLGLFKVSAKDDGTEIKAGFTADIASADIPAGKIKYSTFDDRISFTPSSIEAGAKGDLKLKVTTTIISDFFPSLTTDFGVTGLKTGATGINSPDITFNNITLNYGAFANEMFTKLKGYTDIVLKPLNILNKDIPLIKASLIEIAKKAQKFSGGAFGELVSVDEIDSIIEFFEFIERISEIQQIADQLGKPIDLGSYKISKDGIVQTTTPKSIIDQIYPPSTQNVLSIGQSSQPLVESKAALDSTKGSVLDYFPILQGSNPGKAFIQLLNGQIPESELFLYKTPPLLFEFAPPPYEIRIFGPIVLNIGGSAGAGAQIKLGYDTNGLQQFAKDDFKDPELLFDGLFIANPDGDPELKSKTGVTLRNQVFMAFGELNLGVGVSAKIASVTVGGGVFLNTGVNVIGDKQYLKSFFQNPACALELSGAFGIVAFASASLNLGVFTLTKRFNLARRNLIDFSSGKFCGVDEKNLYGTPMVVTPAIRATLASQGVIERDGTSAPNTIVLQASESSNSQDGKVILTGLVADPGNSNDYTDVKLIVINAGDNDDRVELRDTASSSQLYGEAGNDTLIGGAGIDFLDGGQGDDVLDGGFGVNTAVYANDPSLNSDNQTGVYVNLIDGVARDGYNTVDRLSNIQNIEGSQYNDYLVGNNGINVLDSGLGNDALFGGDGDDVLLAGAGGDYIDGEKGIDTITYLDSSAPVYVNISGKDATVSSPIFGVAFPNLFANRGLGGDAEDDRIFNVEHLHGSSYNDVLIAGNGGGRVDGYLGSDLIYAGSGIDVLDGGLNLTGEDTNWLSYQQSDLVGVKVSLQTGSASGGYAEGDQIMMAYDPNDITAARLNFSSFRNLEGSSRQDVLEGDRQDNILRGLAGDDVISGLVGNDWLMGGEEADTLDGGNGIDTAVYSEAKAGVTVDLVRGGSRGEADGDRFFNIENILGSAYGDKLTGNAGDNDIDPGLMLNGIDDIDGGDGIEDRLTVNYSLSDYGTAGVIGGIPYGYLERNDSDPDLTSKVVFQAIERLYIIGTSQNDQLFGGDLNDVFFTGAGNDYILSGLGSDIISASDGDDILEGSKYYDKFRVAQEIDTLTGGLGADKFVLAEGVTDFQDGRSGSSFYSGNQNSDYALITDFNPDEGDRLQLHNGNREYYSVESTITKIVDSKEVVINGIAIYLRAPIVSQEADLIAIVQPAQGATRLSLRDSFSIDGSSSSGTLENPFIWVGSPLRIR
jgi:Ca2+-binding RTX toxin-like protein